MEISTIRLAKIIGFVVLIYVHQDMLKQFRLQMVHELAKGVLFPLFDHQNIDAKKSGMYIITQCNTGQYYAMQLTLQPFVSEIEPCEMDTVPNSGMLMNQLFFKFIIL